MYFCVFVCELSWLVKFFFLFIVVQCARPMLNTFTFIFAFFHTFFLFLFFIQELISILFLCSCALLGFSLHFLGMVFLCFFFVFGLWKSEAKLRKLLHGLSNIKQKKRKFQKDESNHDNKAERSLYLCSLSFQTFLVVFFLWTSKTRY